MIRLPGDPLLEARLLRKTEERSRARRQGSRDYAKSLDKEISTAGALSRAEWIQFRLLHRQFSGRSVPGLPSAVQAGRFLIKTWRRLRWDA
jgi:hypothetical protein